MRYIAGRAWENAEQWKVRMPDHGEAQQIRTFSDPRLGEAKVTITVDIQSKTCDSANSCELSLNTPPRCTVEVPLYPGEASFSSEIAFCYANISSDRSFRIAAERLLGPIQANENIETTMGRIETMLATRKLKMPFLDTEVHPGIIVWLASLLSVVLAIGLRHELGFPLARGDRAFFLLNTRDKLELGVGALWVGLTCIAPIMCVGASLAAAASLVNDFSIPSDGSKFRALMLLFLVPIAVVLALDLLVSVVRLRRRLAEGDVIERWDRAGD